MTDDPTKAPRPGTPAPEPEPRQPRRPGPDPTVPDDGDREDGDVLPPA